MQLAVLAWLLTAGGPALGLCATAPAAAAAAAAAAASASVATGGAMSDLLNTMVFNTFVLMQLFNQVG